MPYSHAFLRVSVVSMFFLSFTLSPWSQAQIEEVVVTAQKRAEDVQDVPISISTFSGDFMQDSGIDNLQQLSAYTPNLTLAQSSQVANNRIVMRGVGSVGNSGIEPSVAVFIDGVYYPRPSSVVGSLTDLEMVEVLRGPQGTLFGRNASMGALNIRTKKPAEERQATIRASYGSFNAARIQGAASGGLSENLAARLSFHYMDRGGYGDNTFTELGNDDEFGDWKDIAVRGKLYFAPSENIEATLTVDYSEVENQNSIIEVIDDAFLPEYSQTLRAVLSPTGPFRPTGPEPESTDGFDYEVNQDHRDNADDAQWGIAGDINWSLGEHTVRSITAFRDWKNDNFESALRLPADLFNRVTRYDVETFSQELQLISPTGGRVEYIGGFYYYDEDYTIDQNFDLGVNFCNAAGNLVQLSVARAGMIASAPASGAFANMLCASNDQEGAVDTEFGQSLKSYALFGQLTFHASDQVRITGGLRWTKDDKSGSFTSVINNPIVAPFAFPNNPFGLDIRAGETAPDLDFSEEEITWMLNLSYDMTDDVMLFGSVSTGFKSGGFNSDGLNSIGLMSDASRVFDSEKVDNYELGLKSALWNNTVTANLTLFRTKIDNFQSRQFDGVNFLVRNAGELTQQGVELDVQFRPTAQFFGVMGLSYLDSEFDSFPNATNLPAAVAVNQAQNRVLLRAGMPPVPVPPQDLTGTRNHFSPKWQLSLMGEYTNAIPGYALDWYVRGEFQYVSSQNVGAETNNNPQSVQSGYETVNARLGVRSQGAGWELSAFVRNVFDEGYCQAIFNQPIGTTLGLVDPNTGGGMGGMQRCVLGTPRTYAIEAAYRF